MPCYQKLLPYFDAYNGKITNARVEHKLSLSELSEQSGVSFSAVANQSADSAPNPKLFEQAAICSVLGLSLDELCGLAPPADVSALTQRIHELELETARYETETSLLLTEKQEQYNKARSIVFSLVGFCTLLVIAAIGYMLYDMTLKNDGLFRSSGSSAWAVILIVIIIASIILVTYSLFSYRKK